ncbi:hypothetical protein [Nocardioides cynanchi]|uniref:hypothetical protein n=1 Tax=Nocardioides cynanchi TaxID=2558918 RepID=UPI001248D211|nr:hypothetical protein [Nocardioides cynanchi]
MSDAVLTAGVATAGIIIGWFVIGTQRVTEELTKERRAAYGRVLSEAALMADDATSLSPGFEQAVLAAQFLSSGTMHRSGRLRALLDAPDTEAWRSNLEWFSELARFESHRNSSTRRWLRRRWYVDRAKAPTPHDP